jgi:hypothetical protein
MVVGENSCKVGDAITVSDEWENPVEARITEVVGHAIAVEIPDDSAAAKRLRETQAHGSMTLGFRSVQDADA